MLSLLSSGNKLAVLVQSKSTKKHGKGDRPSVVTAFNQGHNKRLCQGQPVLNRRRERARNWLAKVVNRKSGVDSDTEGNQETETDIKDKEIEQEEEYQVVKEQDSEFSDVRSNQLKDMIDSDMTYSIIEVLEAEVIPEAMLRVRSGRTTCLGRALE